MSAGMDAETQRQLEDLNVVGHEILTTPEALKSEYPITDAVRASVSAGRAAVREILERRDPRLLVVVGPCSIHDVEAAHDYAGRLRALADEVGDALLLVMRVYFEKPRTTVGWKGLINDPYLDDSFRIAEGLKIARQLLLDLSETGLPLATEALDPITPQYLQDLISWSAIGARTTESQTHREMASGLSCAVGFKNGTDGGLGVAINALQSTSRPHRFLGISPSGQVAVMHTRGNTLGHVVLRGGGGGPNYDSESVARCEAALASAKLPANVMIDCSHANSEKNPARQAAVLDNIVKQIESGNRSIIGAMIESNIAFGNQALSSDRSQLTYGVSVTDGCIDWNATVACLRDAAARMRPLLRRRAVAA
ncbi:MAG: 3-deoxy-7-phosphoheptulonate synthase [Pseudomonadota bacterium]|nr:3-deoxy-7-phosphoheptulonate synthase [Pseudomonadota bacterium]